MVALPLDTSLTNVWPQVLFSAKKSIVRPKNSGFNYGGRFFANLSNYHHDQKIFENVKREIKTKEFIGKLESS